MQSHKGQFTERLYREALVAVVRAGNREQAEKTVSACLAGGINIIEITFTVPGAPQILELISESNRDTGCLPGAGTVLDSETARIALLAGARYIVGPHFDEATARLCNRYGIPYMAGCMTVKEMITALEAGVEIIKLFPGNFFGPDSIKAFRGPLPHVKIMPTGGVGLENAEEWLRKGAFALGIGGDLTRGALSGDYRKVEETAAAFRKIADTVRTEDRMPGA